MCRRAWTKSTWHVRRLDQVVYYSTCQPWCEPPCSCLALISTWVRAFLMVLWCRCDGAVLRVTVWWYGAVGCVLMFGWCYGAGADGADIRMKGWWCLKGDRLMVLFWWCGVDGAVLKMKVWGCCFMDGGLLVFFSDGIVLMVLLWWCGNDGAVLMMIWWCCFKDRLMVLLKWWIDGPVLMVGYSKRCYNDGGLIVLF